MQRHKITLGIAIRDSRIQIGERRPQTVNMTFSNGHFAPFETLHGGQLGRRFDKQCHPPRSAQQSDGAPVVRSYSGGSRLSRGVREAVVGVWPATPWFIRVG